MKTQTGFPRLCTLLAIAYALMLIGIQIWLTLGIPNALPLISIALAAAVATWTISGGSAHTGMPPGILTTELTEPCEAEPAPAS